MHRLLGAVLAVALSASAVSAADINAPLASGRPAGVHQAQLSTGGSIALGVVVLGTIIAIVSTSGGGSAPAAGGGTTTTTSSTGTSG